MPLGFQKEVKTIDSESQEAFYETGAAKFPISLGLSSHIVTLS